jgi:hypothetical protein
MRRGSTRDRLRKELDVLYFEMEAAGLMDGFPCLMISVLNKSNVLSNESNKSNQIKSNIGILRFIKSNLSHRFDLKNI